MAKLTFLWFDNFGENRTPLHRNGKVPFQKIAKDILKLNLVRTFLTLTLFKYLKFH